MRQPTTNSSIERSLWNHRSKNNISIIEQINVRQEILSHTHTKHFHSNPISLMRLSFLLALTMSSLPSLTSAWVVSGSAVNRPAGVVGQRSASSHKLRMALNYNDPVVAEEFAKVQPLDFDEVEAELLQSGIRAPPTMNDMELKLMLVEVRMRAAGKMPGQNVKAPKPTKFNSKFEEALYTKPAFEAFYNGLKSKGDHNAMNVASEYLNDPVLATQRYGKDYKATIRELTKAMNAAAPVTSAKLTFSGFPANMGEAACRMTLEAVGAIADFQCAESEDLPVLTGTVTFEDIEDAKKAVKQYNGMDMGMGTKLELASV